MQATPEHGRKLEADRPSQLAPCLMEEPTWEASSTRCLVSLIIFQTKFGSMNSWLDCLGSKQPTNLLNLPLLDHCFLPPHRVVYSKSGVSYHYCINET